MTFFSPNHYNPSKLDVSVMGFFPLETTLLLGFPPLSGSNRQSLLGFSPSKLTHPICWWVILHPLQVLIEVTT